MLSPKNASVIGWMLENGKVCFLDEARPEYVTEFRLDALADLGFVDLGYHSGTKVYILTPAGEDALDELERRNNQKRAQNAKLQKEKDADRAYAAQEKRKDRRHNYLVAAFQASLAFLFGLVAEHKLQLIAFVVKLFDK